MRFDSPYRARGTGTACYDDAMVDRKMEGVFPSLLAFGEKKTFIFCGDP